VSAAEQESDLGEAAICPAHEFAGYSGRPDGLPFLNPLVKGTAVTSQVWTGSFQIAATKAASGLIKIEHRGREKKMAPVKGPFSPTHLLSHPNDGGA